MIRNPTLSRLTPVGSGAIATLEFRGVEVWPKIRSALQRFNGNPLAELPTTGESLLVRVNEIGEEAILVVRQVEPETVCELHTHGGEELIRWLIEQFENRGFVTSQPEVSLLAQAETVRAARILLDQSPLRFQRRIQELLQLLDYARWQELEHSLRRLKLLIPAATHLVKPFRLAILGAPNVGKSSLLNALTGFQRSVVAAMPGTTRDTVSSRIALDGWLIEITDTAGLRETEDALEREGIDRARRVLSDLDLCLWVLDSTSQPFGPTTRLLEGVRLSRETLLFVLNKCDRSATWDIRELPQAVRISATTGMGMKTLCERILDRLLPAEPTPGEAIPLRAESQRLISLTAQAVMRRDPVQTQSLLQQLLTSEEGPQ
jgi:tRNA modification GTPase